MGPIDPYSFEKLFALRDEARARENQRRAELGLHESRGRSVRRGTARLLRSLADRIEPRCACVAPGRHQQALRGDS